MKEKRTEQLNIRVTKELNDALTEEAEKLDWAKTKLAEKILSDWIKERNKNGGAISFIINKNETININK